jgi:hypothetical protein
VFVQDSFSFGKRKKRKEKKKQNKTNWEEMLKPDPFGVVAAGMRD